jgi:hypothetical protein
MPRLLEEMHALALGVMRAHQDDAGGGDEELLERAMRMPAALHAARYVMHDKKALRRERQTGAELADREVAARLLDPLQLEALRPHARPPYFVCRGIRSALRVSGRRAHTWRTDSAGGIGARADQAIANRAPRPLARRPSCSSIAQPFCR